MLTTRFEESPHAVDAPFSKAVAPVDAAEYAAHGADGHCLALRDGVVAARCSIWWRRAPRLAGRAVGIVGHYAAADTQAGAHLLDDAVARLGRHGCAIAIGPMDGSTWRRYRLVTEPGTEPPFFMEPVNPPDWPEHFRAAGFSKLARYFSAACTDLAVTDPRLERVRPRMEREGITVRSLDLSRIDDELSAIYRLSAVSFRHNLLYTELSEENYLEQYRRILPWVRPEYVLLAEQAGRLVGFLFAIPDLLSMQRDGTTDTLILKTIAILPGRQFAGLGAILVARCHAAAAGEFRRVIHALMHESNESRSLSGRYGLPFRTYALFSRELQA